MTTFENNKEIFNEATVLVLSYLILGFTDAVVEPETRSTYGQIFIAFCIINVLVHLILLAMNTIGNIVKFFKEIKKKCLKKKNKKAYKIGVKEEEKKENE